MKTTVLKRIKFQYYLISGLSTSTPVSSIMHTSTPDSQRLHESELRTPSPSHVRLSDVLKRKRLSKRSSGSNRSKTRHEDLPLSPSLMQDLLTKAASIGGNTTPARYIPI